MDETAQPLMLTSSNDISCLYVTDRGGSPTGLITDFAAPSFSLSYDPYGVPALSAGGTTTGYQQNPYAFKGGIQDRASGLVKFGLRWYNPTTGTFTQLDTLDAPLDPTNTNRYAFAGADPINLGDPSGAWSFGYMSCDDLALVQNIAEGAGWASATAAVGAGLLGAAPAAAKQAD